MNFLRIKTRTCMQKELLSFLLLQFAKVRLQQTKKIYLIKCTISQEFSKKLIIKNCNKQCCLYRICN